MADSECRLCTTKVMHTHDSECSACGALLDYRDHFPGCGNGDVPLWVIVVPGYTDQVVASVVPGTFPVSALRQFHDLNTYDAVRVRPQDRPSNLTKG